MSQSMNMTHEELVAAFLAAKAENERLKADKHKPRSLTLKVSQKGALSLYGMGRFPVTLYQEQWQKILAAKGDIEAFIAANASQLKLKGDATDPVATA